MGNPCLVRSATRADVPAIVDIEHAVFSDPWSRGAFLELLGPAAFVALLDDEVVGYVFGRAMADEAEVLNLAVREDRRGKGIGRALIETAVTHFRLKRVKTVYLEVRISNMPGQAFYGNLGFRQVGRRRGYYEKPREDALIFALEIGLSKRPA